jgi:hypothetical protein
VRDDYYCDGLEEPAVDVPFEDEEPSYGVYDLKVTASLEGGPYRRHGISLAGFGQREEDFKPREIELEKDSWIYKCALSAAEFNHRLNRGRPISFLDLHTNVEQIAQATQPCRVLVERNINDHGDVLKIDTDVLCNSKDPKWVQVGSNEPSLYPIALMKNQYQDQFSLFPFRFKDTDVQKSIVTNRFEMDQPTNLFGVQPFQPNHIPSFKKRVRAKKLEQGYDESLDLCAHCHAFQSPNGSTLTLVCYKCRTKHHPQCLEFEDPVLIAKCQTYQWSCPNCKLCTACKKPDHDEKLLFCDNCDRATHMFCLEPPLDELPEGDPH